MKRAYIVLSALLLCNALAAEICSMEFCRSNFLQQCRTQIFCVTTPCPQPPPQSCIRFVLEQLAMPPTDTPTTVTLPPGVLPTSFAPPTIPPPTTTPPTTTPASTSTAECDDPANIAQGDFITIGSTDCCAVAGLGCRQLGESCSTTAVLLSQPVGCEAGLTCVITDPGNLALDVPNSGTCQSA